MHRIAPPDRRSSAFLVLAVMLLVGGAFAAVAPAFAQSTAPPRGDRVLTLTGEPLVGAVGGVAVDAAGFIYSADFRETVYKITPDGRVSVFATGLYGASGNTIDARGNLLQSSFNGDYITRIDRHGNQEIIADGLAGPVGIAVGATGDLFVCNCRSNTIARVDDAGSVSTFAQSDLFRCPNGITRGPDDDLYVVNFSDGRMLHVTQDGTVSEFALIPGGGNGHVAFARGNFYVTGFQGQRIYRVSTDGEVSPFAGTGAIGEDDGAAPQATFSWPNGIAAGPQGDRLYVNDFVNRYPPTLAIPPAPQSSVRVVKLASLADTLITALQSDGIEAMIAAHRAWKNDPATAALFTETEVNQLGYQLMSSGQLPAAIEVFKLNVEAYPDSFNVYDSLGEAYMNAGEKELAIENYEKSLEINPANTNAVTMLEKIRGGD
ncbi:MAG: tetratricopeptide repeat protein [Acidobacteriota bacterium]|jgi:sugar lactone lactonase YvrE